MSEIRKFVPLSEINNHGDGKVTASLGIPDYVGEIGLNYPGIRRLMRIGGLGTLRIANPRHSDRDSYEPTIQGYDDRGHATAGMMTKKEVSLYNSSVTDQNSDLPHYARWANAVVEIKTDEIPQRLQADGIPVRSTRGWARYINRALKSGITEAGINHLIKNLTFDDIKKTALLYSVSSAYGPSFYHDLNATGLRLPIICATIATCGRIMEYFISRVKGVGPIKEQRISLFYGPELDRAAVLYAEGKVTKLAKELPEYR